MSESDGRVGGGVSDDLSRRVLSQLLDVDRELTAVDEQLSRVEDIQSGVGGGADERRSDDDRENRRMIKDTVKNALSYVLTSNLKHSDESGSDIDRNYHLCLLRGDIALVAEFVEIHQIDINTCYERVHPLMLSLVKEDYSLLEWLLVKQCFDSSCLHFAISLNVPVRLIELILTHHKELLTHFIRAESVLHLAILQNKELFDLLITSYSVPIDLHEHLTVLQQEIINGNTDNVRHILKHLPDATRLLRGENTLHLSCHYSNVAILQLLLEFDPDLIHTTTVPSRCSPLHVAVLYRQKRTILYLTENYPFLLQQFDFMIRSPLSVYLDGLDEEEEGDREIIDAVYDEEILRIHDKKGKCLLHSQNRYLLRKIRFNRQIDQQNDDDEDEEDEEEGEREDLFVRLRREMDKEKPSDESIVQSAQAKWNTLRRAFHQIKPY